MCTSNAKVRLLKINALGLSTFRQPGKTYSGRKDFLISCLHIGILVMVRSSARCGSRYYLEIPLVGSSAITSSLTFTLRRITLPQPTSKLLMILGLWGDSEGCKGCVFERLCNAITRC